MESKNKIEILNKDIIELSTSNSAFDAILTKNKLEQNELNSKLYKKQEELIEITKEVEKLNGEKNLISERKKYEVEDIKLHNNMLSLKEDELKYNNQKELLNNELESINKELEEARKEEENCNCKLNNLEIDKAKMFSEYNLKTKTITNNEYRINLLESAIENNDKYSYAVKNVLNNPKLKGICDALGNVVTTCDKYMSAIDTALGYSTSFVITETNKDAENAIEYLKENKLGRVTFFPINVIEGKSIDITTMNIIKSENGFIDVASSLVEYNSKYKNIIENQLGNIIVVDNMKNAGLISKRINHRYRVVTLDGEIIHVGGSLTGGVNKKNSSIILDKMELDKLLKENSKLNQDLTLLDESIKNNKEETEKVNLKKDTVNRKVIYNTELLNIKTNEINALKEKLNDITKNITSIDGVLNNNLSNEEESIINKYYDAIKKRDSITSEINKLNNTNKELLDEISTLEHEFKSSGSEYYKKQNEAFS